MSNVLLDFHRNGTSLLLMGIFSIICVFCKYFCLLLTLVVARGARRRHHTLPIIIVFFLANSIVIASLLMDPINILLFTAASTAGGARRGHNAGLSQKGRAARLNHSKNVSFLYPF